MKKIKALTLALVMPVFFYSCASVPENESGDDTNIPDRIQTMPVDEPKPVEAPWLDPARNSETKPEDISEPEETVSEPETESEETVTEDAQTDMEEKNSDEEPVQEESAEEEEPGELFIDENNPLEGLDEPTEDPETESEETVTEDAQTVPQEEAAVPELVQEESAKPEEKPSEHEEAPEPDDGIVDAPKTDAVIDVAREAEKPVPQAKKAVPATPVQAPKKVPAPAVSSVPAPEKTVPAPVITVTPPSLEESAPAAEEKETPAEVKKVPVVTRSVSMQKNQYLDITYPGAGWIYLGEEDGKNLFRYFGRKIGTQDTSFSLRSREEGTTLLHFYKNDVLSETYLDDWLEVTVKGINTDHSRIQAPSYASVVPPKPEKRTYVSLEPKAAEREEGRHLDIPGSAAEKKASATAVNTQIPSKRQDQTAKNVTQSQPAAKAETPSDNSGAVTVIQNADTAKKGAKTAEDSVEKALPQKKESTKTGSRNSSVENTDSMAGDDILNLAKKSFDEGEYSKTLTYLDAFFEKAGSRIDEGLFLQGQTLEANSEVRNIKAALDTYETIVRRYPQSINWAKANERVTYLKRFYFNIR